MLFGLLQGIIRFRPLNSNRLIYSHKYNNYKWNPHFTSDKLYYRNQDPKRPQRTKRMVSLSDAVTYYVVVYESTKNFACTKFLYIEPITNFIRYLNNIVNLVQLMQY